MNQSNFEFKKFEFKIFNSNDSRFLGFAMVKGVASLGSEIPPLLTALTRN
jgi:hypothetical protein